MQCVRLYEDIWNLNFLQYMLDNDQNMNYKENWLLVIFRY